MVFVQKMAIFPTLFFQAIQARKMSFPIFQDEKTPFQAIKTRTAKSPIIDIFPKGLTHGFGPKVAIFPTFFFQEIQARKMSFTIFQNEKTRFQAIKTRSSKNPWLIHGFVRKMAIFLTFFFQAKQVRKMSFTIFNNGKKPFQAIETGILKN